MQKEYSLECNSVGRPESHYVLSLCKQLDSKSEWVLRTVLQLQKQISAFYS